MRNKTRRDKRPEPDRLRPQSLRAGGIQTRQLPGAQAQRGGASKALHLSEAGGAGDGRRHAVAAHQPGQRYFGRFSAALLRHFNQGIDNTQPARIEVFADTAPALALRQVGLLAVFAGQEAGRQAVVAER